MIDKVQYSDFNRFLVSTGYILVAVGLLLPYFYLRENFDLQIETDKLQKLTPIAKSIIEEKHKFSLWLIRLIPWLSIVSIITGLTFLIFGGNRWRKRQKIEDDKITEEVNKLKTENKKAVFELDKSLNAEKVSTEEILKLKEKELQGEQPTISNSEKKVSAQAYFAIEALIAEKFKNEFSDRYNVMSNYRINNLEFDIILSGINFPTSGIDLRKDVIVEIKYSAKRITSQYVIETLERTATLLKNYPKAITNPIVFFIMQDKSSFDENKILEEASEIWSKKTINKWHLLFVDLTELAGMKLKEKIRI